MLKSRSILQLVGVAAVFVLLSATGCSKPPTKEMADAEAALAAAKAAEADLYVPDEYRSAEDRLAQARAELESKEYDEAKRLALESTDLSDQARENAISAKAKAKAEAEELLSKVKAALKEAKEAGSEKYFAQETARIARTLDEMEADYKAEKYLDVLNKGREALNQATLLAAKSRKEAEEEARRLAQEAEKRRIEEARRREEEARRREEEERRRIEEARRREEEERRRREEELRRHPLSHTVSRGECLWKIAEYEKVYSDPFQWPLIYQANRAQIKDPDLIYPAQEFSIKRNADASEISQAITMAKTRGPWSLFDGK